MRPRTFAPLAAILAACSSDPSAEIALPSLGSARTAIAALLVDGALVEARVLEPSAGATVLFDADPARLAEATVVVIGYDAAPAALGAQAGKLLVSASGRPLPAPAIVLTRDLAVEAAAWAPTGALPPALASARFAAFAPQCPSFMKSPLAFTEPSVRFAVEIAGDQALVGLESGALMAVRPGEAPRAVTTSTAVPDGIATAVARADGAVAIIDAFCCVQEGTLDGDVVTLGAPHCPPRDECGIVVAAVAHATGRGIDWLTLDGRVTRFTDEGTFVQLGRFTGLESGGTITRDDQGRTLAAQRSRQVGVAEAASFRVEDAQISTSVQVLAFVDGVGTVVGDALANAYVRDAEGTYTSLGPTDLSGAITAIRGLPDGGVWLIGGAGTGVVWRSGAFCPVDQVGAGVVAFAPRLGDGWLLLGARLASGGEAAVGTWVRIAP